MKLGSFHSILLKYTTKAHFTATPFLKVIRNHSYLQIIWYLQLIQFTVQDSSSFLTRLLHGTRHIRNKRLLTFSGRTNEPLMDIKASCDYNNQPSQKRKKRFFQFI